MRSIRLLVLLGLVAVVAIGALFVLVPAARARLAAAAGAPGTWSTPDSARIATQAAPPPPTLRAAPVAAPAGLYLFGGLPASMVPATAIKNGWTYIWDDARWHVNCMAIQPGWVLTVEMQFAGSPTPTGLQKGADVCASVARQLVYAAPL